MTALKPYPAYRNSGVDWLESIPIHWRMQRLGSVLFERGETNEGLGESTVLSVMSRRGVIPYADKGNVGNRASEDISRYKIVREGDLVLNSMNVIIGSVGISAYKGCLSPVYYVLQQDHSQITPEFAGLLFANQVFQGSLVRLGNGILAHRMRIPFEKLRGEPLPLPPLDEQRAIADFLDAMDARITRFIAARKKMIRLLEEKKQAVIHQAVTKGLDSTVPMKGSGVNWLGEIPAHWEVRRLRSCILDSLVGIWGEEPSPENAADHVWCIRVADFDMDSLRISDAKKTMRAVPTSARIPRLLQRGDLLLEKSGGGENQPVGRVVMFDSNEKAVSSNFVTRLRPDRTVVQPSYLLALMEAMQAARITQLSIKQTTGIQNLDERHYLSNTVPIPSLEEQDRIVEHISREAARIDSLRARTEREIELIQEYRTRLISDVVTGKLDVRGIDLPAVAEGVGEGVEVEIVSEEFDELLFESEAIEA